MMIRQRNIVIMNEDNEVISKRKRTEIYKKEEDIASC